MTAVPVPGAGPRPFPVPEPGRMGPVRLAGPLPLAGPARWASPPAAMLISVPIRAASVAEYEPARSPRVASRFSMATQRGSRSLSMHRIGDAMKMEE